MAAATPLAVCSLLAVFRSSFANTNAALILVLVVVAFAATGLRSAGITAAVSSALWFDFLLTEPYQQFTITDRDDVETMVLLLIVGIAVTEVALWGRRQQAQASRQEGFLGGIMSAASGAAGGTIPQDVLTAGGRSTDHRCPASRRMPLRHRGRGPPASPEPRRKHHVAGSHPGCRTRRAAHRHPSRAARRERRRQPRPFPAHRVHRRSATRSPTAPRRGRARRPGRGRTEEQ